jgi:photosystem II stability/assembly factor-like uncharacterized protein
LGWFPGSKRIWIAVHSQAEKWPAGFNSQPTESDMKKTGLSLLLLAASAFFTPFGFLNAAPTPTATPTPTAAVSKVMTTALEDRDRLPAAVGSLWRFEGPTKLDRGSRTDSGRINEIAIHPTDPKIMYVTGATGGVWKTTDGGKIWASRSKCWPIQAATAVAIDPKNADRVFVGTGDYKRLDHIEPFSAGIMRSLDGGLTWSSVGSNEMREYTVSRIVFDTNNAQNVLAATGRGSRLPGGQVFRSTDGGGTWVSVGLPDANWDDLELSNDCCGTLWASATQRHNLDDAVGASEIGLVYKSANGGDSWTKVNLQVPGGFHLEDVASRPDTIQIACRPESSSVFIAVYENARARVFVTTDAGASWKEMTPDNNPQIPDPCSSANPPPPIPSYPVPVCHNAWAHAAFGVTGNGFAGNRLYVAGVQMFLGQVVVGSFAYSTIEPAQGAGDFHCVVPDPTNPNAVFVACDGGIYRYLVGSGAVDSSLNNTLSIAQIFRMDVHPRHGGLIAFGAQDLGITFSFWDNETPAAALRNPVHWRRTLGGDGRSAAFRRDNSPGVYSANTKGSVERYDGGPQGNNKTLQPAGAPDGQAPLLFQNDTLYYADTDFQRLLNPETQDVALGPVIWSTFPFRTGTAPAPIQSLAFCPTDAQVIYAGSEKGELFLWENEITKWTEVLNRNGLPSLPIWAISPSPSNCREALVAVGYEKEGIRRGDNVFSSEPSLLYKADVLAAGDWFGRHGDPSLPHAPLYAITRLPSAPDEKWFVAGDVGVFRTDNGGSQWANATAPLGLPNTLVRDLRLSGDGNTLYAGTFGRGIWSMDVNPPADHFGVRGTLTQGGRPVAGAVAATGGAGRIMRWLKNTLTSGPIVTTAPINVIQTATISQAEAILRVRYAETVSLVAPDGTLKPMARTSSSGDVQEFALTTASAAGLMRGGTNGDWKFKVTGTPRTTSPLGPRLIPSVVSGFLSLRFTDGVRTLTGPDGEYTIEYLARGSHAVSIVDCNCPLKTIDLQSHRTDVDFRKGN